jgi:predicted RNase H-like nuclease (RuvC/YqgF family)
MRKIILTAVLLSTAFAAAPAAAQYRDYDRGYGHSYNQNHARGIEQQLRQLSQRIDHMYERRLLSGREASRLQRDVADIQRRLYDYSRNGLNPREHQDLQYRIHNLRERLQRERWEGRRERWDDRRDQGRW